jgi:hypothetical protein
VREFGPDYVVLYFFEFLMHFGLLFLINYDRSCLINIDIDRFCLVNIGNKLNFLYYLYLNYQID